MYKKFKKGDRVVHQERGTGTFVAYEKEGCESPRDSAYVQFDLDRNTPGETLLITAGLLKKIAE